MRWTFSSSVPPCADVLELLGLAERLLVGALDADEGGDEVGLDHQLHQLGVVGQVDRGLGEEGQRIALPLLPGDHLAEHLLDRLLVADQVVVDDEDDSHGPSCRIASSSAITWAPVLIRGRRPKVTMMSQNSHWNGQPRENWRLPKA